MTTAECDCTDLDGFMLNVERLMASELVALSTHEVVAAALFLWCRAWKQMPAASLPDDERVISAFAKLPLSKFRKHREEIMRGFVKCSDGRFYHRTLSAEAMAAYERKVAFRRKREIDAKRLATWRANKKGNADEIRCETDSETRFVAEGQGRDRDGTGKVVELNPIANAIGRESANSLSGDASKPDWWPKRDRYGRVVSEITDKILFDTGKAVLGKDAGGQITKLLKCKPYQYDRRAAIELILRADDVAEPRSWFAAALKKAQYDEPELPMHEVFPEQEYRV